MKESMKNISTASYCCKPLNRGQKRYIFPQQRKLMGSSAQNSSGVHWCRSRVRFNEVPEKVPKVPKVAKGQFRQGSGERWGGFSGEGSGEGLGGFGAEPGQVQQGEAGQGSAEDLPLQGQVQQVSGEGFGEGLGGFGAEPGQLQQDWRPFNSRKPS